VNSIDDALEQRFQICVFSNLRSMLKARLVARRSDELRGCDESYSSRRAAAGSSCKDYGYDVQGVFFDVPLEVAWSAHQRVGARPGRYPCAKWRAKLKAPTLRRVFGDHGSAGEAEEERGRVAL